MHLANQEFGLMVAFKRSFLSHNVNKEPHFPLHCVAVATVIKEIRRRRRDGQWTLVDIKLSLLHSLHIWYSSDWYAVLCKSSGFGRLSGTNRWFRTCLVKLLRQQLLSQLWNLARNPWCLKKNFVRWMWFLFCQIKQKIGKETPTSKYPLEVNLPSYSAMLWIPNLHFAFPLILQYCVEFLHICVASASAYEIGDCLVPKGPPHYNWFFVFFSSLSRQASVGYC